MNALELIREAGLPPDQLAIVQGAFEGAWIRVRTQLGKDISPENARIRLASIVLLLTRIIKDDRERLQMAALKVFNRHHECVGQDFPEKPDKEMPGQKTRQFV